MGDQSTPINWCSWAPTTRGKSHNINCETRVKSQFFISIFGAGPTSNDVAPYIDLKQQILETPKIETPNLIEKLLNPKLLMKKPSIRYS